MMGGWGGMMGGFSPLGWLFGTLFSLGLLVLLILAIVWLLRQITAPRTGITNPGTPSGNVPTSTSNRTCPTCGRPVAVDWTVCPYDGTPLT